MAAVSFDQTTQQHHCKLPCSYLSRKAKEEAEKSSLQDSEEEYENLFDQPIIKVIRSGFERYLKEHEIMTSSAYQLDNRTLTIIKRSGTETSGSTSAMMIALDQFQKIIGLQTNAHSSETAPPQKELFSEDFLRWVREGETKSGKDLVGHLKKDGFNPALVYLIKNISFSDNFEGIDNIFMYQGVEVIERISHLLSQSGNSLTISVQLPKIGLHWLVIDEILVEKSVHIYLRDSFTGKAYKVLTSDFLNLLSLMETESGKIEVVYIKPLT